MGHIAGVGDVLMCRADASAKEALHVFRGSREYVYSPGGKHLFHQSKPPMRKQRGCTPGRSLRAICEGKVESSLLSADESLYGNGQ